MNNGSGVAIDVGNENKREALLTEIFTVLDQKHRGFISRIELAHILDAMQADSSVKFSVPESLVPTGNLKDSRISRSDLPKLLGGLGIADLEDVKWFAESVVKVENELREVWLKAVVGWRERVERLYSRNLHRYLLMSQPERVSRWLLLRTSMDDITTDDTINGLLGLGISQQEVEVLFTDETADDICQCSDKIEPFLTSLDLRHELSQIFVELDVSQPLQSETEHRVCDSLIKLAELCDSCREIACLLIHEDTLSYITALVRSAVSQAVVCHGSKLIMALLNYRVHENARDYEKACRRKLAEYLEIDISLDGFSLDIERQKLAIFPAEPKRPAQLFVGTTETTIWLNIADWVASLLTLRVDSDRGEMLDALIKFDEKRLAPESDGGLRTVEDAPIATSLFSWGRTVIYVLNRLDISSHHSLHEHRTPIRTHLWKFLMNVLSSTGERGRHLFRLGDGMRVVCNAIRGNAWGVERDEVTPDVEEDRLEEQEVCRVGRGAWPPSDPYHSWPYIESSAGTSGEHRYYSMDFQDDKFYGSKDRMLAAAFLEYMSSEAMWGEATIVEEMMQYPNTLQVLCRVQPPCCLLVKMLLSSPGFPEYLKSVAHRVAEACGEESVSSTCNPDAMRHSLFPVCYDTGVPALRKALVSFRERIVEIEMRNISLRILAHAYHSLEVCLQVQQEKITGQGETAGQSAGTASPQLEDEICQCCRSLASRLPLCTQEIRDISVSIYAQIKEFTRKALLVANPLPLARPDDRQEAPGIANASSTLTRYTAETFTVPHEFLVVLRIVQLIRLRDQAQVPPFVVDLQDSLEQLIGQGSSFMVADTRQDIELAGAEYPWRTGLAQLKTFQVCQVPLRRSELRPFPRRSPVEVVNGLEAVLSQYKDLNLQRWSRQSDKDSQLSAAQEALPSDGDEAPSEALVKRQRSLLALVFNHLCYFHPKIVTIEDSAQGLALRLGLSEETLRQVKALLMQPSFEDLATVEDFAATRVLDGCEYRAFQGGSPMGTIVTLQVPAGEGKKVAFVCMAGAWTLWANCTQDTTRVLTDCGRINEYYSCDRNEN